MEFASSHHSGTQKIQVAQYRCDQLVHPCLRLHSPDGDRNKECVGIWKEVIMAFVRHCPHICFEGVSTPTENVKRYLVCQLKL